MSNIRGTHTRPEVCLRQVLHRAGFRFRLGYKLIGKPDVVFVSRKIAIFIDGCFWHKCPTHATKPKTNAAFWREKLNRNMIRDKEVNKLLRRQKWKVLRFWEHQVDKNPQSVLKRVATALSN